MGVRNNIYSCKNFPVNIDVDLYTLRLLILPKTCSKVRNSVFATHCTVDTLDVVHTDRHAVAISRVVSKVHTHIHTYIQLAVEMGS